MLSNLLSGYKAENEVLQAELKNVRFEAMEAEAQTENITRDVENLKQYTEITELNRKVVTSLIQSIHISEPSLNGRERNYDVEIRYKFQRNYQPYGSGKTEAAVEERVCGLGTTQGNQKFLYEYSHKKSNTVSPNTVLP